MVVVVVDMAVVLAADVAVVVEPVFMVGITAADSFSFSFSLSALSSDQYLETGAQRAGHSWTFREETEKEERGCRAVLTRATCLTAAVPKADTAAFLQPCVILHWIYF